jgi:hypothetical protein
MTLTTTVRHAKQMLSTFNPNDDGTLDPSSNPTAPFPPAPEGMHTR